MCILGDPKFQDNLCYVYYNVSMKTINVTCFKGEVASKNREKKDTEKSTETPHQKTEKTEIPHQKTGTLA